MLVTPSLVGVDVAQLLLSCSFIIVISVIMMIILVDCFYLFCLQLLLLLLFVVTAAVIILQWVLVWCCSTFLLALPLSVCFRVFSSFCGGSGRCETQSAPPSLPLLLPFLFFCPSPQDVATRNRMRTRKNSEKRRKAGKVRAKNAGRQKGGLVKGGFGRMYPRSGLRSGGTCERTLVPVFVPGEHPNVPRSGLRSRGTSAKTTLLENHPLSTPEPGECQAVSEYGFAYGSNCESSNFRWIPT